MSNRLRDAARRSIEVLSVRPDLASITTTARATLEDETVCTVSVGDHVLTLDLPSGAGGLDTGPTPSQTLVGALAACLAQTYMAKAALSRVEIKSIEVEAEGDFDARGMYGIHPDARPGFQQFRYEVIIDSPEPDERIAEIHATVARLSPLLDDLSRPLELAGTWRRAEGAQSRAGG